MAKIKIPELNLEAEGTVEEIIELIKLSTKKPTPLQIIPCVYCGGDKIVRRGVRKNKNGNIQRFMCKVCGRRFSASRGKYEES